MIKIRSFKIIIFRIFQTVFTSKKKFKIPLHKKILILDSYSIRIIKKFLIQNQEFELLDLKRREINIPVFLLLLFYYFKYGKNSYEVCFIKLLKPKIAITFIDNNYYYYNIFKFLYECKLIMIQNGNIGSNRYDIRKIPIENRRCDYYFILNNCSKVFFEKYCGIKSNYLLAGSQEANFHKKLTHTEKITNQITIVSTYRKKNRYESEDYNNFFIKPTQFIRNVINKLIISKDFNLNILLISDDESEKKFFTKIFQPLKLNFIENEIRNNFRKSYFKLNSNSVYIGDSKLLTECLSLGYKTMFFSLRGYYTNDETYSFGWPINKSLYGDFWINNPNKKKGIEILLKIMKLKHSDWLNIIRKNKNYHHYDFNNDGSKNLIRKLLVN